MHACVWVITFSIHHPKNNKLWLLICSMNLLTWLKRQQYIIFLIYFIRMIWIRHSKLFYFILSSLYGMYMYGKSEKQIMVIDYWAGKGYSSRTPIHTLWFSWASMLSWVMMSVTFICYVYGLMLLFYNKYKFHRELRL